MPMMIFVPTDESKTRSLEDAIMLAVYCTNRQNPRTRA
jgi:hypothetical protein